MSYAPVIIFVYNRVDHFLQTYDALTKCPEAKFTDLFIFSDGAKNKNDFDKVESVRKAVAEINKRSDFKSVNITENSVNKGLASSVISGVTEVINKYNKVIVVEDDCSVSPFFLNYMNGALNYYSGNLSVGSISGYCPPVNLPYDYSNDVFSAYRSCSWTWATWLDRWENVDWKLKNISDFYKSPKLINKLNSNGNDRFMRLYRQTKGNGSSWSVRFGAHLVKNNQVTIYPRFSYTQNIGCDDSGVHSSKSDNDKVRVDLSKAIENPVFSDININKKIQKILKKHYSCGFISDIKKFVATVLIILKESFNR